MLRAKKSTRYHNGMLAQLCKIENMAVGAAAGCPTNLAGAGCRRG